MAIITPSRLFQYVQMPFGQCYAPATFRRVMDITLGELKWSQCMIYIDDILIFTRTCDEMCTRSDNVGNQKLETANMTTKLKKCTFVQSQYSSKDNQLMNSEQEWTRQKLRLQQNLSHRLRQSFRSDYKRYRNLYGCVQKI